MRVVIPFRNGNSATRGDYKAAKHSEVVIPFRNGNSATVNSVRSLGSLSERVVIPFRNGNSATFLRKLQASM